MIFYTNKQQLNIALTLFFNNRLLILWCLNAYRYDNMLNFNEKIFTLSNILLRVIILNSL